jgi:Helix-turn-helix domain
MLVVVRINRHLRKISRMDMPRPRFVQRPPIAWFGHPAVGAPELAVLSVLLYYADRFGRCHPSQSTIATLLRKSRPWVNSVIAGLVEYGLIERERRRLGRGGETSCTYSLIGVGTNAEAGVADANMPRPPADTPCQPADTLMEYNEQEDPPSHAGVHEEEILVDLEARRAEPTAPPLNWTPTPADTAWALARYPDLDVLAFTEHFLLTCRAKGYRYADPSAAWRRWLLEPKGRLPLITEPTGETRHDRSAEDRDPSARCPGPRGGARAGRRHAPQQTSGEARVAAWGRALARRQAARADADGGAG